MLPPPPAPILATLSLSPSPPGTLLSATRPDSSHTRQDQLGRGSVATLTPSAGWTLSAAEQSLAGRALSSAGNGITGVEHGVSGLRDRALPIPPQLPSGRW